MTAPDQFRPRTRRAQAAKIDPPKGREHDSCRSDSVLLRHETQAEPANASPGREIQKKHEREEAAAAFGQTLRF